jgi:hypothetical protein
VTVFDQDFLRRLRKYVAPNVLYESTDSYTRIFIDGE